MTSALVNVPEVELEPVRWADWRVDPAPLYRQLRDAHPVFWDEPNRMYLVTRYADVDAVLKDPGRFSSTPLHLVDHERISPLREEDPPRHTFLRRTVMGLFTPAQMRQRAAAFTEIARALLDRAERDEIVEVSSALAVPLPGRVTCDLLGVPVSEHTRFLTLTAERLSLLHDSERGVEESPRRPLQAVRDDLWAIVGRAVEARRADPRPDAITLLVQAQEQHGTEAIGDWLIVDMLLHLLTGGFHTTQHLIESLIDLLADRPDLWRALREDRSLVPVAIDEMLRFDAPVQALRRRTTEPVALHGVPLPADATVGIVYGAANRDDRVFEDPDQFSLTRGSTRHMAFSAGIHYCPGAPVSRFEVRALLDEMLDRYPSISRAGPSERWPVAGRTVEAMHGYRRVPVRLHRDA